MLLDAPWTRLVWTLQRRKADAYGPPRQPLTMQTSANTARQRTVMATIADLIVTAAAGKALRVAVGYASPDQTAFAEQLTSALHARGRSCHRLAAKPSCTVVDACTSTDSQAGDATVAVITSGARGTDETEVCRVNIQLYGPAQLDASNASGHEPDGRGPGTGSGQGVDIVVDYHDPGGPTIRHLGAGRHTAARPA